LYKVITYFMEWEYDFGDIIYNEGMNFDRIIIIYSGTVSIQKYFIPKNHEDDGFVN